jgi:CPA2 family monovalent cation:H+ antiporter-2
MLASHTLVWVGVPLSRVMRRVSHVRGERYGLLRGLFQGRDETDSGAHLHSVTLDPGARAIGKSLGELDLQVQVQAVRRRGVKARLSAAEAGVLEAGDVVVLLGTPEALADAEERLR